MRGSLLRIMKKLSLLSAILLACLSQAQSRQAVLGHFSKRVVMTTQQIMANEFFLPQRPVPVEDDKNIHEPDLGARPMRGNALPEKRFAISPRSTAGSIITDPALVFGTNINAVDKASTNSYPPDSMGAVGPSNFLVHINGRIRSFDLSGNQGSLNAGTDTFWSSVIPSGYYSGDPRCKFDPTSGRWILVMDAFPTTPTWIMVAYSDGPTISNSTKWTFLSFEEDKTSTTGDTNELADYPTLGVDSNALYIGVNMFSSGGSYTGSSLFVIPKAQMFAGGNSVYAFRDVAGPTTEGPYTPQGVDNFVSSAQGTGYFLGVDIFASNYLALIPINDPGGTPTLGTMQTIAVPNITSPKSITPTGSTKPINADDSRLMAAQIFQNQLTGAVSLWTTNHIGVNSSGSASNSATQDAARFYQISLTGPSLLQSGTIYDPSGNSFLYPTVAMNGAGQAVMGFTEMGTSLAPQTVICRQVAEDASGTMPVSLVAASGNSNTYNYGGQNGKYRWGDYSFTSISPVDGLTAWSIQEFVDGTNSFAEQVTQVMAPPPPTLASISPTQIVHGYSGTLDVYGTQTAYGQDFFEPSSDLSSYRKDIKIRFGGNDFLGGVTPTVSSATHLTMTTVASDTSVGTFALSVTNPDGQSAPGSVSLTVMPALTGISLDNSAVVGGNSVNCTVTLEQNAIVPETISLSVPSGSPVVVPASEQITTGSDHIQFAIQTTTLASDTQVTISASDPGNVHTVTTTLTVTTNGINVSSVTPNSASVTGGSSVDGTVTLSSNAPTGGAQVAMSTDNAAASFAASPITVNANANTGSFTVNTVPVATDTLVHLTGKYEGSSMNGSLTVLAPRVTAFQASNTTVTGSLNATATVTLGSALPAGGITVTFASGNTNVIPTPASVVATNQTFQVSIPTNWVTSTYIVRVSANANGSSQLLSLKVVPAVMYKFAFGTSTIQGGTSASALAEISGYAPAGGANVLLKSLNTSVAQVTSPSNIPQGSYQKLVTVTTSPVSADTTVTIEAAFGGVMKTANLTVTAAKLSSLKFASATVLSGGTVSLTANLTGNAGPGGTTVSTGVQPSGSLTIPALTVAANSSSNSVNVTAGDVSADTAVTVSGTVGSVSKTASITVQAAHLAALSLASSTVVGGNPVQANITLDAPAGSSGPAVTFKFGNAAASLSGPVYLTQGQTTGTAQIQTTAVTHATTVTIIATANGVSKTVYLTVEP